MLNRRRFHGAALAAVTMISGVGATAVLAAGGDAITNPAEAGPSFKVQGEYAGKSTDGQSWGAQVVSMGKGAYQVVFFSGGLPGAGWNKQGRLVVQGKGEGETAKFEHAEHKLTGTIEGGKIKGAVGPTVTFEMAKVERKSPTLGMKAPDGGVILFNGTSAEGWQNGKLTEGNLLNSGVRSKQAFGDFTAHLEFRTPYMEEARGQGRGNSGVYVQDRYEVQVLDSFGLTGEDNECGGIYKQGKPQQNMCLPPLAWQTYDIDFTAARVDADGKKTAPAEITIRHNGVVIHDKMKLSGVTPGGGKATEDGTPGPFHFQNHGNPVVFRNIWVVEKK